MMDTRKPGPERVPDALTLSKFEAARMLGISLRTIDRLIAMKQLPVRRLGRRVLIPRDSLRNLLSADRPTHAAS
jgi:excisionase family DNA binding protein